MLNYDIIRKKVIAMKENIFKIAKLEALSNIKFEVYKFNYSINNELKEALNFFISGSDVNNDFNMELLLHYSLRWCQKLELGKKQIIDSDKIEITFRESELYDLDTKYIVEIVRYLDSKYLMSVIFYNDEYMGKIQIDFTEDEIKESEEKI